jgi:hypothetical protein
MKSYYFILSLLIIGCQRNIKQTGIRTDSISEIKDTLAPLTAQENEQTKPFHEVYTTDLNNDGHTDTITLSNPPLDPGTFQTIEVALNGGDRKTFQVRSNAWDTIDAGFLKENQNAINSPLVFVYKDKQQFTILLFGFVFGAGRENFNIIYGKDAHFKMVFDAPYEYPLKLQDLNHDGKLELLGRKTGYECYGQDIIDSLGPVSIGTYAPFSVFRIDTDTAIPDETATREYNEQHYIWKGPDYSEKLKVYYPENGHQPVLAKE